MPSCLLCAAGLFRVNDGSAFGAMRVSNQVSVIGYDDLPLAQRVQPCLTSDGEGYRLRAAQLPAPKSRSLNR